jgi:hypothetical protein
MEPILIIGIPGLLGGLLLALLIFRFQRPSERPSDASRPEVMAPMNAINMARIRVNGIGGLGMVAMATVVAFFVPQIRQSMAIALVLGVLFAVVLIVRRRRDGPLPSSGGRPGANTALSIDNPWPAEQQDGRDPSNTQELAPVVLGWRRPGLITDSR